MTDLEYNLLVRIRDTRVSVDDEFSAEERVALRYFLHKDRSWVRVSRKLFYAITTRGEYAILEHEEKNKHIAKEKAEQKRDERKRSVFSFAKVLFELVKDVFLILLGIMIERGWNVSDLVDWLFK